MEGGGVRLEGSGALAGANQPVSRPENASRPRLLRAFGGEFGAMAKTATGVHCGLGRVGLSRREEAALYSGSCGASCEAGGGTMFVTRAAARESWGPTTLQPRRDQPAAGDCNPRRHS